jgi:hypothetical protein
VPPVVAAIASFAAWAATALGSIGITVAATTISTFIWGQIIATALSFGASALSKPRNGNLSQRGNTLTFRSPTEAARVIYGTTRVGGVIVYASTSNEGGNENTYVHMVIALAGHEVDAIGDVYFGEEVVPLDGNGNATGFYAGHVRVRKWLGRHDQAADALLMAEKPGEITAAHRFRGISCLYVRLRADTEGKWPNGIPNISAIVRGRKIYDSRNSGHVITDPETWTHSATATLCLTDYLRGVPMRTTTTDLVRPYGVGASDTEIDWDVVNVEANVCDEFVTTATGALERRYAINGELLTDESTPSILSHMLTAQAGSLAYSGGKWLPMCGYYRTPTVSLDDDDLAGGHETQINRQRRDLFNGVKGVFISPADAYQPVDFPSIQIPDYITEDGGEEIFQDVEFRFTQTVSACQRLAAIMLRKNRQQTVRRAPYKMTALQTRVMDNVLLSDTKRGWVDRPFEIQRWALRQEPSEGAVTTFIDLTLASTDPSVYAPLTGLERLGTVSPATTLPNPRLVSPPGSPGIVEELYSTRTPGGVKTRVTCTWTASSTAAVELYQLEWRAEGAGTWNVEPQQASNVKVFQDFAAGRYEFRVRAINSLGSYSIYSTSALQTVSGLSAPPSAPVTVQVQARGNHADLVWPQASDLDVKEGGQVEFRHSPATTGATWDASRKIRESVPGGETHAVVPLIAGTYLTRFVDSSGNASTPVTVVTKQQSQHGFTGRSGSPITESPGFSGTKSGCAVSAGRLFLSGAGLVDGISDFDAVSDLDSFGGLATEGSYTFASSFDFGSVVNSRVTVTLDMITVTTGDTIDSRIASMDDWPDFDGAVTGAGDAWVEFRQSDDNVTFTPWMRIDVAEINARYIQFRLQMRVTDTAYNIEIITLSVRAEAVS